MPTETTNQQAKPEEVIKDVLALFRIWDEETVARRIIGSLIAAGYQIREAEVIDNG